MAKLFMICGLPASGKTTLAKRLETEHDALCLIPDEWMARIVGTGDDDAKRTAIEHIQWEIAQRALALGTNVILEFGFWFRRERDEVRAQAAALGADVRLYYLEVPRDELVERLIARNRALPPNSFHVEPSQLDLWIPQFEPPTADELASSV